jgi:hypothetical protein
MIQSILNNFKETDKFTCLYITNKKNWKSNDFHVLFLLSKPIYGVINI